MDDSSNAFMVGNYLYSKLSRSGVSRHIGTGGIDALKDLAGRARIQVRIDRLLHGNAGQHRKLSDGVSELKIDSGPGYRVYYTIRGTRLLLLLVGGDKSSQRRDIAKAIRLAKEFQE